MRNTFRMKRNTQACKRDGLGRLVRAVMACRGRLGGKGCVFAGVPERKLEGMIK